MLIALHWAEWLRRVEVVRFDAKSPVAVEDYLAKELDPDRTAFVFDDTDRPMVQAVAAAWQGRWSNKQLAEIHNALVAQEGSGALPVAKFKNRDEALTQIAVTLVQIGKSAVPYHIPTTTEDNMDTNDQNQTDAGGAPAEQDPAAAAQAAEETPAAAKARVAAEKAAEKEAAKKAAADKKAADKAAKDKEKADKKAADAAAKPPGVIASLQSLLLDGTHRTVDELYTELATKFPDRGEAMKTTIRVQLVRMPKERPILIHNEDRKDAEGKKLAGKSYWGEATTPAQPAA